jgi:hypothetical protein
VGGISGPTQIADGFIVDGGHVHGRQVPRTEEPRQREGIAPIGLHFVARLLGNQRGRDHVAGKALAGQVAVQVIAARAGLVGEYERRRLALQPSNQFVEIALACADRTEKHGRVRALSLCVRDGDGILMNVQTNEKRCRLCHG